MLRTSTIAIVLLIASLGLMAQDSYFNLYNHGGLWSDGHLLQDYDDNVVYGMGLAVEVPWGGEYIAKYDKQSGEVLAVQTFFFENASIDLGAEAIAFYEDKILIQLISSRPERKLYVFALDHSLDQVDTLLVLDQYYDEEVGITGFMRDFFLDDDQIIISKFHHNLNDSEGFNENLISLYRYDLLTGTTTVDSIYQRSSSANIYFSPLLHDRDDIGYLMNTNLSDRSKEISLETVVGDSLLPQASITIPSTEGYNSISAHDDYFLLSTSIKLQNSNRWRSKLYLLDKDLQIVWSDIVNPSAEDTRSTTAWHVVAPSYDGQYVFDVGETTVDYPNSQSGYEEVVFAAKYTMDGEQLWYKTYDVHPEYFNTFLMVNDLVPTSDGGTLVYGYVFWYEPVSIDSLESIRRTMLFKIDGDGEMVDFAPVSTEEVQEETLVIYPNPAITTITIPDSEDGDLYSIWTTAGEQVSCGEVSDGEVSVEALSAGMYILVMQSSDGSLHQCRLYKADGG